MNVGQIMKNTPITGNSDMTVKEAVSVMTKNKIGSLLIMKGKVLVGIMTERDVLEKVVMKSAVPEKVMVWEIMTENPITIHKKNTLEEAAAKLTKNKIKKLPVVDESGKLIGIITDTDIVSHQPSMVKSITRTITNKERKKVKKKLRPLMYSYILLAFLLAVSVAAFARILKPLVENSLISQETMTLIFGFIVFLTLLSSVTGILVYVNLIKKK